MIILTAPLILEALPVILFVCPLSSQSYSEFKALHIKLPPGDHLQKMSFARVEHCHVISAKRLTLPRLAQLTPDELLIISSRLQHMIGI